MGNNKNKRQKRTFTAQEKENLKDVSRGSWFNQTDNYECETGKCAKHSASIHKLDIPDDSFSSDLTCPSASNYIMNMNVLQTNLCNLTVCAICREGVIIIKENREKRKGCVPDMYVDCSNEKCELKGEGFTTQWFGLAYELNKTVVLAARASGAGESALCKLFAFLGLPPPPTKSTWGDHQAGLADDVEIVTEEDMSRAVSELKDVKRKLGECLDDDECVDVGVSFDGTWNHVGHSASFCVVFAISIDTGKVIDYEFKYKLCKMCKSMEAKKGTAEYDTWKRNHASSCTKSHDGFSSSMESACIVDLYRRSVEKNGLRYTVFVGDGDSSSYRNVVRENIYGQDVTITKENCVGHVQKRMGTRLRKLLQETKGQKLEDGKCLSGRERLTQKVIDSFQVFYGIAIRSNGGNVEAMQRATRAIIRHYSATPENPTHELCPTGDSSWCMYQVDKATGSTTYRYPKYPMPEGVYKHVEPVINDLASEKLLSTSQLGLTQNANESCHSMLWRLVSKRQYNSEAAYRISATLTVGHWNSGEESFNTAVCKHIGVSVPDISLQSWRKIDKKRVWDAEYKYTPERKQRKKDIRKESLKMEDAFQKLEGDTYKPGMSLDSSACVRKCKKCKLPMKGHKRSLCI